MRFLSRFKWAAAWLTCACTLLVAAPAWPQSEADRDRAAALVFAGDEKRNAGDHKGALQDYRAADKIMGVPSTGIEVARELEALGRLTDAREKFLKVARYPQNGDEPEAFVRARAEARKSAANLDKRIPELRVSVTGASSDSVTVTIDGEKHVGVGEPVRLDPGQHGVEASASGGRSTERTIMLQEGDASSLELQLPTLDGDDDDDVGSSDDSENLTHVRKNFVSVTVQVDHTFVQGAQDVCGSVDSSGNFEQDFPEYYCFNGDDGGEFLGKPVGREFNEIVGGAALASSVRLLAGYDRLLWHGLAVGGRVGYAFGGGPTVGDAEDRFDDCEEQYGDDVCRPPLASDFSPLHVEARLSYFIGGAEGLLRGYIRPHAFAAIGFAETRAGATISLCDTVENDGGPLTDPEPGTRCPAFTAKRDDIEVRQVAGLAFAGLGGGAIFAMHPSFGINVELKLMLLFPTQGFAVSQTAGPVFMF